MSSLRPSMIDEAFLAFLRDGRAAEQYRKDPRCAVDLCRDPWSAEVWWLYQEFYNTDAHREQILKEIADKKQKLPPLKRELELANNTPALSPPQAPFFALQCDKKHPLRQAAEQYHELCGICSKFQRDTAKHCEQCNMGVCVKCFDAYYPNEDLSFLWFLSSESNIASVAYRLKYNTTPGNQENIRRLREKFYYTEQYKTDLKEMIRETEDEVKALEEKFNQALERLI